MRQTKPAKDIFLYGTASMINDASSEIVKSLVPLLIANPVLAGIAGGAIEGLAESLKFFFGYLSDRLRSRKKFILTGYVTSGIARLLLAAIGKGIIIPAIIVDRIGKGIRDSPRDAAIAEKERNVFLGFSIQRAMDNMGAAAGVIASLALLGLIGLRNLLWVSAAIGLVSFVPIAFTRESKKIRKSAPFKNYRKILAIASFGIAGINYIFITMAYPGTNPVLLYAIFNLTYALLVVPFSFESLISKKYLLIFGYAIFSLSVLLSWSGISPYITMVSYGVGYGLIKTTAKKVVAGMSESKGSSIGLLRSSYGMLALAGNVLAGLLWEVAGKATLLVFGLAGLAIGWAVSMFISSHDIE